MTTYSTSLKLALIADGDQAGIWGQTTNTNLGTLLEQAITGVVSIVMTDATYTLTDFNGTSDEARNAVLVVSGTNAAIRNIVAPSVKKLYVIKNNTTGGYAIRIKTAAGTGTLIPNGVTTAVYCDGSEFYEQQTGSVGNFSVNGDLSVTGTTSLTNALAVTSGGTGATTASGARTNLGLGTIATQNSNNVSITGGSITGITDLAIADGGTGASTANAALNNLLPSQTSANGKYLKSNGTDSSWDAIDLSTSDISGTLPVANGGTGATTASSARTNLGLGTIATQDSSNVSITGGSITGITDLAIADGGTGASTASGARTNLGLGTIATQDANNVSITGGAISGASISAASPSFTGTPTAPTAAVDTNTTQLATTAYVIGQGYLKSSTASSTYAPLASPALTGTPTAPTATAGTNTTQLATTAFATTAIANAIPSGIISLWYGSVASIPSGWALCNGLNGTPDLRDRFIVGAGSTYAVAATGGSKDAIVVSHTHTATVTDPGHTHNTYGKAENNAIPSGGAQVIVSRTSNPTQNTATTLATTDISVGISTTGSSGTNANLPPYYALAYIMKL